MDGRAGWRAGPQVKDWTTEYIPGTEAQSTVCSHIHRTWVRKRTRPLTRTRLQTPYALHLPNPALKDCFPTPSCPVVTPSPSPTLCIDTCDTKPLRNLQSRHPPKAKLMLLVSSARFFFPSIPSLHVCLVPAPHLLQPVHKKPEQQSGPLSQAAVAFDCVPVLRT